MSQQFTMYRLLDIISQKEGICEICGRPDTGKTTLMLQIIDKVNKRKDGTAIIFSMAEGETKISQMVKRLNAACDRVIIYDTPHPTAKYIEERIKEWWCVSSGLYNS